MNLMNLKKFYQIFFGLVLSLLMSSVYALASAPANTSNSVNGAPEKFVSGKDYVVIDVSDSSSQNANSSNKVKVTEFFSYGCPWCYKLEPHLEKWLSANKDKIDFSRMPVNFEQGWQSFAKAYFVANELSISNKLTPKIFNAVQKQNKDLTNDAAMIQFFIANGVNPQTAKNAFAPSPVLDTKIKQISAKMQQYKVYVIPSFVVAGKYRTDLRMTKGDLNKLLKVVGFLVNKSQG